MCRYEVKEVGVNGWSRGIESRLAIIGHSSRGHSEQRDEIWMRLTVREVAETIMICFVSLLSSEIKTKPASATLISKYETDVSMRGSLFFFVRVSDT